MNQTVTMESADVQSKVKVSPNNIRVDIQALRGLAVLLVVLYHTKMGGLPGGYLGVDIFFVISGFLITQLIASHVLRGNFSLWEFYSRRAKRLLPVAYVTFFITAILAPWFLNQQELHDFASQMVGAVTFTSNFVLWQQTGYFEGASDLKPLLHIWSLAIEEQYYFLLPAILLIIKPSRWLICALILILLSLGLCFIGGLIKPIASFYLLPTRAWELIIGTAGALLLQQGNDVARGAIATLCKLLLFPAIFSLMLIPFFPFGGIHPGLNAFLICIATLVVLLSTNTALNSSIVTKALGRVGDVSYSLYMVHWPVIAFVKNAWVGSTYEVQFKWRFMTLALSFFSLTCCIGLSKNQYGKYPFRYRRDH